MKPRWSLLLLVPVAAASTTAQNPSTVPPNDVTVFASEPAEALEWDARIRSLEGAGTLQRVAVHEDTVAPGWQHERLQQYHRGLRVFGAQVIRHTGPGSIVTVNGKFRDKVDVNTTAGIGPVQALLAAEASAGAGGRGVGEPERVVYLADGGPVLAYMLHVRTRTDLVLCFVDAHSGSVIDSWSDLKAQAMLGRGVGTWRDDKKLAVTAEGGTYVARDGLRPAAALTVDAMGNYDAWNYYRMNPFTSTARDADNDWRDGMVVDAHGYAGWVCDYYFKRFGRRGLDDANGMVISYVHFWPRGRGDHPFLNDAFWDSTDGSVNYGDGDGTKYEAFSSALDIVAHELTHGVTDYTSGLAYRGESGALSEAFSDIMGIGAEFYYEDAGFGRQRADWGVGEDVFINNFTAGGNWYVIRYPPDPEVAGDPDHYAHRFTGGRDNGGVHTNSLIVSHAFYLFVEGGTDRTSGIRVSGIGFSNIERAEKIFYRAFTSYLVPRSSFWDARLATLQCARDLHGVGSREEQQLALAWDAVGVQ
jgi:Zn-dependent metalloprotease